MESGQTEPPTSPATTQTAVVKAGRRVELIVGRNGSGKTTLVKTLIAALPRVLIWDWRGEYTGELVTLRECLDLFERKKFLAVFRPGREPLPLAFRKLAEALMLLGELYAQKNRALNFCLVVDEFPLVNPPAYAEGGLGYLLRYARPYGMDMILATQTPTRIPSVCISEISDLHCFHLHHKAHLAAMNEMIPPDKLELVPALRDFQYFSFNLRQGATP